MSVAKSFENFIFLSEPFEENGKEYIVVKNPKTGTIRKVRWYRSETVRTKSVREVLGFAQGYITIFKGENEEWLEMSEARYHKIWGWYFPSQIEVPAILPVELTPVKLYWKDIAEDENTLRPVTKIKACVEAVLYPTDTKSTYQGTVGERIERELTVIKNIPKEGNKYGTTYFHILQDKDENIYIWATAAKNWAVGSVHTLRGTVKEHQKFRNELQTVLTRCMEVNK